MSNPGFQAIETRTIHLKWRCFGQPGAQKLCPALRGARTEPGMILFRPENQSASKNKPQAILLKGHTNMQENLLARANGRAEDAAMPRARWNGKANPKHTKAEVTQSLAEGTRRLERELAA